MVLSKRGAAAASQHIVSLTRRVWRFRGEYLAPYNRNIISPFSKNLTFVLDSLHYMAFLQQWLWEKRRHLSLIHISVVLGPVILDGIQ